jgi:hypothetical protein
MVWSIRLVIASAVCLHCSNFAASAGEGLSSWVGGNRLRHHVREAVKPISVNIVDPMTKAYSLPSGRIFIADPPYWRSHAEFHYQRQSHAGQMARYAPPAFYIIGEPSRKNMSKPVTLNHGIQARRGLKTQPNVVFLVQKPGQKFLSVKN